MEILKIVRGKETDKENYIIITFKGLWSKETTEVCITGKNSIKTIYAKNGEWLPVSLWDTISAFIRTGDKIHEY